MLLCALCVWRLLLVLCIFVGTGQCLSFNRRLRPTCYSSWCQVLQTPVAYVTAATSALSLSPPSELEIKRLVVLSGILCVCVCLCTRWLIIAITSLHQQRKHQRRLLHFPPSPEANLLFLLPPLPGVQKSLHLAEICTHERLLVLQMLSN